MSDKDQFTFDDDDDFPEADLSSAFSDGEVEADNPAPEVQEKPEPTEEKKSKKTTKSSGSGGSRSRSLLIVLLLVVAGAAGAYYFMDLGGTSPVVPTAPAQKAQKKVAVPPQPAKVQPAVPAKAEPAKKAVSVAVPPPPPAEAVAKPVAEAPAEAAPDKKVADAEAGPDPAVKPAAKPAQEVPEKPAVKAAVPAPKPQPAAQPAAQAEPAAQARPAAAVEPVQQATEAKVVQVPKPAPVPAPAVAPAQVAGGAFTLDAGSYLFESNRDSLVAKIKKLGYESLVTPVDAKLDMTRLRIGTYRKEDVQKGLDLARAIEPGAYSAPAGDGYVIYAGTFLNKDTVEKLTKRFQAEGIKVHPEPVQVIRTLSRIRFGSFATRDDAMAAADAVSKAGVKAVVVKAK